MRKNKYILEMNYSKLIEIHIIDLGYIYIRCIKDISLVSIYTPVINIIIKFFPLFSVVVNKKKEDEYKL